MRRTRPPFRTDLKHVMRGSKEWAFMAHRRFDGRSVRKRSPQRIQQLTTKVALSPIARYESIGTGRLEPERDSIRSEESVP
jgi:hypothetical protein